MLYYFSIDLHKLFEKDQKVLERFKLMYVKGGDMIAMFRRFAEAKKGKDLLAINYENGTPMLLIQNPDLVAEFMQKENEVCKKDMFTELPTDIGFIMENGAHGLSRR